MTTSALPVQSQATQVLRHSAHPALRRLSVEETDTALVIRGSVTSYYLKQLAQETLKAVRGPRVLVNDVEVVLD
jgi:hypothetical protein